MSTPVGQQALVDQWERTTLAFGKEVGDAEYADFQRLSRRGALYGVASALVNVPVAIVAAAVAVFFVFGRGPGFSTILAVATASGVVLMLRVVVSAPLAYVRETTTSATSLGLWFPAFDEAAPLARLLGLIDLFAVWWVVVLAIGVSVLYRRPATRLATAFMGVYIGIAAGLALLMVALGGLN